MRISLAKNLTFRHVMRWTNIRQLNNQQLIYSWPHLHIRRHLSKTQKKNLKKLLKRNFFFLNKKSEKVVTDESADNERVNQSIIRTAGASARCRLTRWNPNVCDTGTLKSHDTLHVTLIESGGPRITWPHPVTLQSAKVTSLSGYLATYFNFLSWELKVKKRFCWLEQPSSR